MRNHPDPETFLVIGVIGVIVLVALAVRALNRRHTVGKDVSAQACVLAVEVQKDLRGGAELFYVIQLAIPRPDGTEIVAALTAFHDPPQPGWIVPVRYLERLGNTTKVAPVGPFRPVAEPQSPERPDTL